jgi:hypothetical protein
VKQVLSWKISWFQSHFDQTDRDVASYWYLLGDAIDEIGEGAIVLLGEERLA